MSGLKLVSPVLALTLCVGAAVLSGVRQAQAGPVAVAPYTLAALTNLVPPSGATQPDDLAVTADGLDLWIGYGNGVDTFGKGGLSNLVEYDLSSGAVLQNLIIPGHLDGLKINPTTNDIWATENEDGNPTLAIVNHVTGEFTIDTFSPTLITGGPRRPRLLRAELQRRIYCRFIPGQHYHASHRSNFRQADDRHGRYIDAARRPLLCGTSPRIPRRPPTRLATPIR